MSVAIALRGDGLSVIVPEDEVALARKGWADRVILFCAGSLEKLHTAVEAVRQPFEDALKPVAGRGSRIGIETGEGSEPASYSATHFYGAALCELLRHA